MGAIFLGLGSPPGRSWAAFWASWGRLGRRSQERKNVDTPLRKPLFRKHSFSLLGALVGSLGLLLAPPGPILGPKWPPKLFQKQPKTGPKTVPKTGPIFSSFWTNFGASFGPQNSAASVKVFRGGSRCPFLAPSWPILAPLGALLATFWPHGSSGPHVGPILAHLGHILAHLGAIFAPSLPILGFLWPFLGLSWALFGTLLGHLGPAFAILAYFGTPNSTRWSAADRRAVRSREYVFCQFLR